jgi:hypothetical protein
MNLAQLEHVLRAAGAITGARRFIILGSQAILAATPNPPLELTVSMEVDTYPEDAPEKADLVDGTIGELSPFHETYGYYAHGVGPETAVLPRGWRGRVLSIESPATQGIQGLCLAPVDLAISKLVAGREKDRAFVRVMLRQGLVTKTQIDQILGELTPEQADLVRRAC